jgi:DNA invertase Pin-like site-specific DNA recombinase
MDALAKRGILASNVFSDKATGANFERPGYSALIDNLKKGDLVVVASVDRLGRDYDEIQEQWRIITKVIRADVEVLDMPLLNTRSAIGGLTGIFLADIVLQIMCYLAQMERDKTRQRQREGIEAAKARGQKFGHPFIEIPDNFDEVLTAYKRREIKRKDAAMKLGVSPSTFDRWIRRTESSQI